MKNDNNQEAVKPVRAWAIFDENGIKASSVHQAEILFNLRDGCKAIEVMITPIESKEPVSTAETGVRNHQEIKFMTDLQAQKSAANVIERHGEILDKLAKDPCRSCGAIGAHFCVGSTGHATTGYIQSEPVSPVAEENDDNFEIWWKQKWSFGNKPTAEIVYSIFRKANNNAIKKIDELNAKIKSHEEETGNLKEIIANKKHIIEELEAKTKSDAVEIDRLKKVVDHQYSELATSYRYSQSIESQLEKAKELVKAIQDRIPASQWIKVNEEMLPFLYRKQVIPNPTKTQLKDASDELARVQAETAEAMNRWLQARGEADTVEPKEISAEEALKWLDSSGYIVLRGNGDYCVRHFTPQGSIIIGRGESSLEAIRDAMKDDGK